MDMPFITHITGELPMVTAGRCKRDRASSSLRPRSSRQRQLGSWLHRPTCGLERSVCTCRRRRSGSSHKTRSCSPKEIRRELHAIPKMIHIPFRLEPAGQPSSQVVREPGIDPTSTSITAQQATRGDHFLVLACSTLREKPNSIGL